tara:strand:- start:83 stop:319 length:237 start_codon:yes stop_codon:yes gene_type:complete
MDEYGGDKVSEEKVLEQGGLSSEEEGFMQGYLDEEETPECSECGAALDDEKNIIRKELDDELQAFCSKSCSEEFEDSI